MRDQARSNSAVRINKFKGKQIKVSSYRTNNSVCSDHLEAKKKKNKRCILTPPEAPPPVK